MCEVLILFTIQNPRKLSLKKKLKKRLSTEFPMLLEKWPTFSITVNKYFLPLRLKFNVRLKAVLRFISQNLEGIDHPVSEIKNYNDRHIAFSHKYTWILRWNYMLWHRKRLRTWVCVFRIIMDGVFFTDSNTNDWGEGMVIFN